MKFKAKVLARFPEAYAIVANDEPEPPWWIIKTQFDAKSKSLFIAGRYPASAAGAWRNAWYWCVRHPNDFGRGGTV